KCKYEVIDEKAGIRPTIKDRRPVLGAHPEHKNMYVYNGMGTKGISLAPYFSNELILHITENKEIDKEIGIQRFI
ncbi:MAG TPA: FAD-dependent oxidoreductase, partial [Chitinophagales bacterium]|nr:FAD-dependent oxidoreductase [Chitinophagales bacterium]